MEETTVVVPTRDGLELQVYRWAPEGAPKAVIQVQHGLAEHAARYRRFGEALTGAGYLVYAPDGRGSGRTAHGDYGNWGPDGWPGWVDDLVQLNARIRHDNPGLPVGLFGHSMGSFATQNYLLDHSSDVDAVVLSGTGEVSGLADALGGDGPADLSAFNAPFENRTGFEWLSRDDAEVDKYVADPACGWVAPAPGDFASIKRAADPAALAGIREDLPILIVSGDHDPVAGPEAAGPQIVGERYRNAGVQAVTVKLYPGARHELLNETNRDEVTADIIAFFDASLA
ncbi:alpha/beta hydrolase [Brooklawnia cerclae]|uniref:Alpha-beta hydrolase superfamily lysophospholipase n=1 Tax=Brooklawnia cerclae TaxID=349934 RepID=A0ABX0SK61_9ACTN|nr:alpha/beta hydrolase [Brooklawnia cerclae]NIH57713.1 alpha-beta hydrolase superfamily lysophospholipase [Brooklawnia cerclae]